MASSDLYLTTESEITSIANAIRSKGGTLDFLTYPTGFVTAIEEIQTGGALQSKSVTPSESSITVVPDVGYDGLSQVSVDAISSNYIGSGVARKSAADLTASGSIITAPAGYYSAQATKAVSSAVQATPTITVSTAGLITATATQTAGYVAAGSTSATKQLTVKAAATYTPSITNQTIASGQYLTGIQTIAGDSNLIAGNIKLGTSIFGISGTYEDFPVASAVLHVNAPLGSTITLSHASIDIDLNYTKGHQNIDGKTMDWYYSVGSSNYGYWAISAFNSNADSTYASVTINSAKQYDIELTYNLYLIKNGIIKVPYSTTATGVTIEQYADSIGIVFSNDGRAFWVQLTAEVLGGIHYRTFVADFKDMPPQPNAYILWGIRTTTTGNYTTGWLANLQSSNSMEFPNHSEIDISSVAYENQYAEIWCRYATRSVEVVNIYLKR